MVVSAEEAARRAESDYVNDPGYCLQQTRLWCDIPACYPDAATAWKHATGKRPGDRKPPRGAPVYWGGGSSGYGHIALSVGGGKIRSTDANGPGGVATVDLGWVESHWGLPYAGWADSINGVTIPGLGEDEDEMKPEDFEKIRDIVKQEVHAAVPHYVASILAGEVDDHEPEPTTVKKSLRLSADAVRALRDAM